jgi:hypothetical protein
MKERKQTAVEAVVDDAKIPALVIREAARAKTPYVLVDLTSRNKILIFTRIGRLVSTVLFL